MKWLELHLDTQPAGIEPATELLSEYGIDSLMIDEEGDFKDFLENNHQYWDYVDDELMEQMHGKSRITFYLEDSAEGYNTLAQFRIGLSAFKKQHPEYAPLILSMENVEDADWENNWKQFYKPMEIGERLLVVPEWEQAQEDGRVKLVLNPGLTFGTGSHATTRLCLQALEQHIHGGEKVLDLGCGSGILSIAALLLGAKDAFACDIDDKCVGVIIALAPQVGKLLKKGGIFLCSGIIDDRADEVREKLVEAGWTIEETRSSEGWFSYLCR